MTPRVPVAPEHVDEYGVVDPSGHVPAVVAARGDLIGALGALGALDPVAQELCRLHNARHQRCEVCMRWRYTDVEERLLAAADDPSGRADADLTPEQRAALRLARIYLHDPRVPVGDDRAAILAALTPEQIVEVVVGQFRFTWNKALVALGFDGTATPTG